MQCLQRDTYIALVLGMRQFIWIIVYIYSKADIAAWMEKNAKKKNPAPKRIDQELTSWQNHMDHERNQWRSEHYPGNICLYVGI